MVTLADELPFAAVVENDYLANTCSSCFKVKKEGVWSRCIKCRVLRYCSGECQQKDWLDHKKECSLLKKSSPFVPSSMERLMARVIFKSERADPQYRAFNGRRYEHLLDNHEEIQGNTSHYESFAMLATDMEAYMKKYVPNRDVLLSTYGKCATNAHSIYKEARIIGIGLYIGLSAQNHSCAPDAFLVFDGMKALLRSPDETKKYSTDITINYVALLLSKEERNAQLQKTYYFTCACSICSDPTTEFRENSARSICCPDSYCLLDPDASQLSCFNCGALSKINVHEAVYSHAAVSFVCTKMTNDQKQNLIKDKAAYLRSLVNLYEKHSKVLSPFNIKLLRITDKIVEIGIKLEEYQLCQKYVETLLKGYKHYRPFGHCALSYHLIDVSCVMILSHASAKRCQEVVDETLAATLASHGPDHPYYLTIRPMLLSNEMNIMEHGA